jgi:hypothetical protein
MGLYRGSDARYLVVLPDRYRAINFMYRDNQESRFYGREEVLSMLRLGENAGRCIIGSTAIAQSFVFVGRIVHSV